MAVKAPVDKLTVRERFTGRRRVGPTQTAGVPGFVVYSGWLQPGEKSPDLASHDNRYRTYSDILLNTSIVGAGVRYFLNLVGRASWSFAPAEADRDAFYAETCEAMLTDDPETSWHRIVRRAGTYRFYGFNMHEWTARRREDGWLTFANIEPRAQFTIERWHTDPKTRRLEAAVQQDPQSHRDIPIPRSKLFYVVDDTLSDSPEGLGLLRQLVSPAKRLARYEQLEGIGFEVDLRGVPVVRIPMAELDEMVRKGELTEEARKALEADLLKFLHNHIKNPELGVLLDSMTYASTDESGRPSNVPKWNIELLKGGASSFGENAAAIERLNRELARLLGVEQLLLGSDSKGSHALSRDKTQSFFLLVESALIEIREAVERDLVAALWRLNGWPVEMMPELATEAVQFRDVEQITTSLRNMAQAGAVLDPDDPVIVEVIELMGLSRPGASVGSDQRAEPDDDDMDMDDAA